MEEREERWKKEREDIEKYLSKENGGKFPFFIKADLAKEAQKLVGGKGEEEEEEEEMERGVRGVSGFVYKTVFMKHLLEVGKKYARTCISNFRVACVGQTKEDNLALGVNMEFPPLPLHCCVHAEQSMLSTLLNNQQKTLKLFYVSHAPCGHCRQFIKEVLDPSETLIIITSRKKYYKYSQLLPESFGPSDLGVEKTLFEYENQRVHLQVEESERLDLHLQHPPKEKGEEGREGLVNEKLLEELREKLREKFGYSHSPYSSSPSSLLLLTESGVLGEGCYMESAAYNPSLPPLQSALVSLLSNGGKFEEIRLVLLLESSTATISQLDTSVLLLKILSPSFSFFSYKIDVKKML